MNCVLYESVAAHTLALSPSTTVRRPQQDGSEMLKVSSKSLDLPRICNLLQYLLAWDKYYYTT